jgi:nucleoside-diphosphate-sugar epimerase
MHLDLSGATVAVTGATGLIGCRVAHALLRRGARVRALVRTPGRADQLLQLGADIRRFDLEDPSSFRRHMSGCQVVFHFAAVLNEFLSYRHYRSSNVEGTRALAEAAVAEGVERFIYASTVWVHGMGYGLNINEESPTVPSSSYYASTKREAEHVIRSLHRDRGLPVIIVQPTQVYGPGDAIWTLRPIQLIQRNRMVFVGGGRGIIQPIYVDDVVTGILLAAEHGTVGETYLLCGDKSFTMAEFFGHYTRMLDKKPPPSLPRWLAFVVASLAEATAHVLQRPPLFTRQEVRAMTTQSTYDGSKALRELGFFPRTGLEQGIRAVDKWIRESGIQS